MKKGKKIVAYMLVCCMLISAIPASAKEETSTSEVVEHLQEDINKKNEVPVPEEVEEKKQPESVVESKEPESQEPEIPIREQQDFTGNKNEVEISVYGAIYENQSKEKLVVDADQQAKRLDLSQMAASQFQLDMSIRFLRESETREIKGNDSFQFTIPQAYFELEHTQEPVPVYNSVWEDVTLPTNLQVAEYTVTNNVVTVTIHPNVEAESTKYVLAAMHLQIKVKKEALDKAVVTEAALEGTEYAILLPIAPKEETEEKQPQEKETTGKNVEADNSTAAETIVEDKDIEQSPKETKKNTLLPKIRKAFSGFASSFSTEKKAKKALETSYEFTKQSGNLPEGFNEIDLVLLSKEGGYKKGDLDNKVQFDITTFMDEDELYLMSERLLQNYPDFPQGPEEDVQAWMNQIDQWRVANPEAIADYTFSYDLGEYFQGQEPVTREMVLTRNGQDITVGSYQVVDGVLSISVHPICCFMDNVYFKESIEASLNEDKLSDKPIEVVIGDDGALVFQSEGTAGGGTDQPEDDTYEVIKEGPAKVTGTSIEYKIRVTSLQEGQTLNGKTLTDMVPPGLAVTKGSVLLNGTIEEQVQDTEGKPSNTYTFAPYVESEHNAITSANFTFVMELTPETYQTYIKDGINATFKNKAKLTGGDLDKQEIISKEVSTKMESKFIKKAGKAENIEGTRYAWNVQLNTKLSSMEDGYLVDTLCETDHQYDFSKGMTVQTDEGAVVVRDFEELTPPGPAWAALTTDSIQALVLDSAFTQHKAYYYRVDETDALGNQILNPFYTLGGTEPEYKQRTILILPYKGLQGIERSKKVTITYETELNMHGLDAEAYWDKINTTGQKPTIDNKVNLLWNNTSGQGGPGPVGQDQVDFGKTVDTDPGAVVKKGAGYNPATQMLTWNVEVNKLGSDMKEVMLTDTLPAGHYDVPRELAVQWHSYRSAGGGLIDSDVLPQGVEHKDEKGRYYEIVSNANDSTDVNIYLGNVGPMQDGSGGYEFYKLQFALKVTDPAILATQSESQTKQNTMKLKAEINGQPKDYSDTGEQTTPNHLIEKKAVGAYDYATFELPWTITINPNKFPIQNAVVTDTIETDFEFGNVTKVEKNGVEDPAMFEQIKDQGVPFALGDITDAYTIYYTTKATQAWRDANLKNGTGTQTSIQVPNTAQLDGTIYGQPIVGAEDTATHKINKDPLGKSGQYDASTGTITWTVDVNKEHFNVSGLKMVEELTKEGAVAIQELDPDTIEIWTVEMGPDGEELLTEVPITDDDFTSIGATGFTYQFPANGGANYNSYRFIFTTHLTAEAKGAKIVNKIYLQDEHDRNINESGSSDGSYDGGYEFDKDVHAQSRPRIELHKISTNSNEPGDKKKQLGLDGAEFELEVCLFEVDEGTKTVKVGAPVYKYGKVRISQNGEAYFPNIKTSTQAVTDKSDLICVLKETKEPAGYNNPNKPHFIYFSPSGSGNLIQDNTEIITYEQQSYTTGTDAYYDYKEIKEGKTEAATVTMENAPTPSIFTFTKNQIKLDSYGLLQGSTPTFTEELAPGVVFKVTAIGGQAEKLKSVTVTSDANGAITIENLDAGSYLLTETSPNPGHKPGTVELKVTWDKETDQYVYAFEPNSAKGGITLKNGALHNGLNTGNVAFTKYAKYADGNEDQIVPNSQNREILAGVTFRLEKTPNSVGPSAVHMETTSNAEGTVEFDQLPIGQYDIYEVYGTKAIPGYVTTSTEELVYQVTVSEDITQESRPVTVTMTPQRTSAVDTETSINNKPITGTIQFQKQSTDTTLSALDQKNIAGATFGLYRNIGTTEATQPLYQTVSDENGMVIFQNVEYGAYMLKEMQAPKGYKPIENISITKADIQQFIQTDGTTFLYRPGLVQPPETEVVVFDEIVKTDVALVKKDKDKVAMAGVMFDVYRRGEKAIEGDGTNLVLDVPETKKDYYTYGPLPSVTSDTAGAVSLPALPYGDYLLVERTAGLALQDNANKVAILIAVAGDGTAENLTIRGNDNANLLKMTNEDGYQNVDSSKFAACTEKEDGKTVVINQKKYGFVNLNKAAGEKASSGPLDQTLQPYPDQSNPKYIKDATFEISKKESDGTYAPYLTLKTNENGQLDRSQAQDTQGAYWDVIEREYKHLWYGEYKIKESSAPDGLEITTQETAFEIGRVEDAFAGHEGTAWISFNGNNTQVNYIEAGGASDAKPLYLNAIARGRFQVEKIETNTSNKLSGAEFVVSTTTGTEVAALKESDSTTGTYELTDKTFTGGSYQVVNELGISYLSERNGQFLLLAGDYNVTEITPPGGYKLSSMETQVEVVSGANTEKVTIENEPFSLSIIKKSTDATLTEQLTGAEFVLEGAFADTTATKKSITDSNRDTIAGLVVGEAYRLTEVKAPIGYVKHAASITFDIGTDGSIQNLQTPGAAKGQITATASAITFKNSPNELVLEKRATDVLPGTTGDGNLLNGAEFSITNKENDADTFVVPVIGGRISIKAKLTGGATYVLKETKAPTDYEPKANDVTFSVGEDGTIKGSNLNGNKIVVYNEPIRIAFTKVGKYNESCSNSDPEAVRPLGGVTFGAYDINDPNTLVETATSKEDGSVVFPQLAHATYIVRELKTVSGYKLDASDYYAEITAQGAQPLKIRNESGAFVSLKENTIVNDMHRADIIFTKVSEKDTSKVLPGSEYGLYKQKSEQPVVRGLRAVWSMFSSKVNEAELRLVATAVTDEKGVLTFPGVLVNTEYVVKELRAPDGNYISKHPMKITFGTEVNEKGETIIKVRSIEDGSGTVKVDPDTGEIIWLEPEVEVSFLKKTPDGTMLQGAALEVQDEKGSVMEAWTSEKEAHHISGKLVVGQTYRLVETAAPTGYMIADPIAFTIENVAVGPNQNNIHEIIMVDEPINGSQPKPPTPNDTKSIKTGDTQSMIVWFAILLVAAGTSIITLRRRRNRK